MSSNSNTYPFTVQVSAKATSYVVCTECIEILWKQVRQENLWPWGGRPLVLAENRIFSSKISKHLQAAVWNQGCRCFLFPAVSRRHDAVYTHKSDTFQQVLRKSNSMFWLRHQRTLHGVWARHACKWMRCRLFLDAACGSLCQRSRDDVSQCQAHSLCSNGCNSQDPRWRMVSRAGLIHFPLFLALSLDSRPRSIWVCFSGCLISWSIQLCCI